MLVSGVAAIAEVSGVKPLSAVEKEEGQLAFSALFYQYGAKLSAEILVLTWIVAVIMPRAVEYVRKRKEEQERARLAAHAAQNPPPQPPVRVLP